MTSLLGLLQAAIVAVVTQDVGKAVDTALALLRSVLGPEDSVKRLERSVDKLLRQPWRTGLERLRIAISLQPRSASELSHRTSKARDALLELERAWGMADLEAQVPINLMRGLAAALIPGAEEEAVEHLRRYVEAVEPLRQSLLFRAKIFDADAEGLRLQAAKFSTGGTRPAGGGLVSFEAASDLLRKDRLLRRASQEAAFAVDLRAQAEMTQHCQGTVESLIGMIEERRNAAV